MALPQPAACWDKWIANPEALVRWIKDEKAAWIDIFNDRLANVSVLKDKKKTDVMRAEVPKPLQATFDLLLENKITHKTRTQKECEADKLDLMETCSNASVTEQYERDIAMWYGQLKYAGDKGKELAQRLLGLLYNAGVMYRKKDGSWHDVTSVKPEIPVASLVSHGGRIVVQLPMSNSIARNVTALLAAVPKGILSIFTEAFGEGKSLAGHGGLAGFAEGLVVNAVTEGFALLPKMKEAGDDRFFSWFDGGTLHKRALASHSTNLADGWGEPVYKEHHLLVTEEKASGKHVFSNLYDGMAGRHMFKNLSLGGKPGDDMNPYSGCTINKDGNHGHLYVNYRAPRWKLFGSLLVGAEGSNPGMSNQVGDTHSSKGIKNPYSCTGGQKWEELLGGAIYAGKSKDDVTQFLCDYSCWHTSEAIKIAGGAFKAEDLNKPPKKVEPADWEEVLARI
jgi:hypothetical protein